MSQFMYKVIGSQFAVLAMQLERDFKTPRPQFVDTLITSLRNDIDLLFKTWSIMAARNVLMSIEHALTLALKEPQLTAASKTVATKLREQVQKVLGEQSLAKARYDTVLLCGYKIKTTAPSFAGNFDDHADMTSRVDEMIKAIGHAYNNVDAKHQADDRMLKVFMAPEFFFRGTHGGYDSSDVLGLAPQSEGQTLAEFSGKKGLVELLQAEVGKDKYKHWLFVLGTVIMLTKTTEFRCQVPGCTGTVKHDHAKGATHSAPKCSASTTGNDHAVREETLGATVDNLAIICKEKLVHTVSKELVSGVDFITKTQTHWRTGAVLSQTKDQVSVDGESMKVLRFKQSSKYDAATDKASTFQDERMGGNIFTLDGVTFGCEVCLDHAATASKKNAGRLANAAGIQVQLIPSGGMETCQFRTVENGVVFNVDGTAPHVQAVGRKGPDGITLYENLERRRLEAKLANWDPERMAELLEDGNDFEPEWKKSTAKAPAPAPRGSILEYGPFEIPKP